MRLRTLLGGEECGCGCEPRFEGERLVVDAGGCEGSGLVERERDCRATVVDALADGDAQRVLVRAGGAERAYTGQAAALLLAAGRFAERVRLHDDRLAERARRDPLAAAREATGRADATADIAAETGFAEVAAAAEAESVLTPVEGLAVSYWRVDPSLPDGPLASRRDLETGATVRRYRTGDTWRYHIKPAGRRLDGAARATLAAAADRLTGATEELTPRAAVESVVDRSGPAVETVAAVLEKHTRGYGLLEDLFADPAVTDIYVTAPAAENPVRVVADGQPMRTNVLLAERGLNALASRFRHESGRAFSRAAPTLDASVELQGRPVRVAGLRPPASDGLAFVFRAHRREPWRLGDLVDNGTLPPEPAALLSVSVERGTSILLVGARGAGKTTMLGALLWELPPSVRTLAVEDTPELPVERLQAAGRDVQALRTGQDGGEITPAEALRTALRLGDGALVVGEVRGEEAPVLYEAMRVGATSEAVLGTVHGDGAEAVYERVVEDLGVAPAAFGATDLVVTLETARAGRRVSRIEEITSGDPPAFDPLYTLQGEELASTGRVERGNSRVVAGLAAPTESYEDVRSTLAARTRQFAEPAGRTEHTLWD